MKAPFFIPSRGALLAAALLLLVPGLVAGQGFKWWQSEKFQRELALTSEQIAHIEEIFQSAMPDLRQQKDKLDRLEKELERLIDTSTDETALTQQVDRIEAKRSALSRARTMMLFRMRRVLTSDQRVKLSALHQEWERERRRSRDKDRRE
jgi:Spy/CpxP family protein refolding chaperone